LLYIRNQINSDLISSYQITSSGQTKQHKHEQHKIAQKS